MKHFTIKDLVFIKNNSNEFTNPCTGQKIKKKNKLPKGAIIVNNQSEAERIYSLNS